MWRILNDIIEVCFDAFYFIQPDCMDITEAKKNVQCCADEAVKMYCLRQW